MAGTVSKTEITHASVRKITFDWTTTSDGAASATTDHYYTGEILGVAQIPDSGGTQPTNLYDVTVSDGDGVDVLFGLGANLSNAATTYKSHADGLCAVVESKLSLAVANAGNAKGGQTVLFIR